MTLPNRQLSQRRDAGMLFVSGYASRIAVERGHLCVEYGIAGAREAVRAPRVAPGFSRLVIVGHSGTVTLDALRWMTKVGITIVHLDNDGRLLMTNAPRTVSDVRVRRGQALSHLNGVALNAAKLLIGEKLAGQTRVVSKLGNVGAVAWLNEARSLLDGALSAEDVRFIESKGAAAYWSAWQAVAVHFRPSDAKRIPAHWSTFGPRRSVLTESPRKAVNPANAMLNYLYAILEAEARVAILRVGADPSMGVLHRDSTRRESFAADLMEAVRPSVDEYLRQLLASQTFAARDFFETADGNCRVMPSVARPLAETASRWAKELAPIAEETAGMFAAGMTLPIAGQPTSSTALPVRFRTPLTQANRSRSHAERRRKRASATALPTRCRGCGCDLGSLQRTHCDRCENAARVKAAQLAREAQAHLRGDGKDSRTTEAAREKHRRATARQMRASLRWDAAHAAESFDVGEYQRTIAPKLRDVPIQALVTATGLSVVYCRQLRLGKRIPHARHWDALQHVAEQLGNRVPAEWDARFYLREIAPRLARLTPAEIAAGTGLSIPYCKRVRRGLQLPRRHHWPSLAKVAGIPNTSRA